MTYGEAGRGLGEHPNRLRYAAPTGTVLIRWDGARQPTVWTVPPPVRRRHSPDGRLPRAVPPDQDRAGGCGVPQAVGVLAEPAPRLAVGHRPAAEEGAETSGEVLGDPTALRVVRQPPSEKTARSRAAARTR